MYPNLRLTPVTDHRRDPMPAEGGRPERRSEGVSRSAPTLTERGGPRLLAGDVQVAPFSVFSASAPLPHAPLLGTPVFGAPPLHEHLPALPARAREAEPEPRVQVTSRANAAFLSSQAQSATEWLSQLPHENRREERVVYLMAGLPVAIKERWKAAAQLICTELNQRKLFVSLPTEVSSACMHWAISRHDHDMLELLGVCKGAYTSLGQPLSCTHLHTAALHNNLAAARALLAFPGGYRQMMHAQDAVGATALVYACMQGHDVARFLLTLPEPEGGYRPCPRQVAAFSERQIPLHLMGVHGTRTLTELLLAVEGQAQLLARDRYQRIPLMQAAMFGRTDLLPAFLAHQHCLQEQLNAKDRAGMTALDLARDRGHEAVAQMLEAAAVPRTTASSRTTTTTWTSERGNG